MQKRSYNILSPEQVARVMDVSLKTVLRWISTKKLRAVKLGKKVYRIHESDLRRFIDNHSVR